MTFAEFIAACFWPLVILFGLLLARTKDAVLMRWFLTAALITGFTYFGLWVLYPQSSIIAVLDAYVMGVLMGVGFVGSGLGMLQFKKPFDLRGNLGDRYCVARRGSCLVLRDNCISRPVSGAYRAQRPSAESENPGALSRGGVRSGYCGPNGEDDDPRARSS